MNGSKERLVQTRERVWMCMTCLSILPFCGIVCLTASAAGGEQAASYRLEEGTVAAGTGTLSSSSYIMNGLVSQPSPVGETAGETFVLNSGVEVPAAVVEMLRFALVAGWNLKGSPGLTAEQIGKIFTGVRGAPIKIGDLEFYDTETGAYALSQDTDAIPANRAFWVFSYWGGTGTEFSLANPGVAMTTWIDSLASGWNLFSPSIPITVPEDSRILSIWKWDATAGTYLELYPGDVMSVLEGYWVLTY